MCIRDRCFILATRTTSWAAWSIAIFSWVLIAVYWSRAIPLEAVPGIREVLNTADTLGVSRPEDIRPWRTLSQRGFRRDLAQVLGAFGLVSVSFASVTRSPFWLLSSVLISPLLLVAAEGNEVRKFRANVRNELSRVAAEGPAAVQRNLAEQIRVRREELEVLEREFIIGHAAIDRVHE